MHAVFVQSVHCTSVTYDLLANWILIIQRARSMELDLMPLREVVNEQEKKGRIKWYI